MNNAQCMVGAVEAPYAHTALSALSLAMEEEGLVAVVRRAPLRLPRHARAQREA